MCIMDALLAINDRLPSDIDGHETEYLYLEANFELRKYSTKRKFHNRRILLLNDKEGQNAHEDS